MSDQVSEIPVKNGHVYAIDTHPMKDAESAYLPTHFGDFDEHTIELNPLRVWCTADIPDMVPDLIQDLRMENPLAPASIAFEEDPSEANFWMVRSGERVDAEVLQKNPQLLMALRPGVGVRDIFDLDAFGDNLTLWQNFHLHSRGAVVRRALAGILNYEVRLADRKRAFAQSGQRDPLPKDAGYDFPIEDFASKTFLIVGHGRIGSEMAKRIRSLYPEATIQCVDPEPRVRPEEATLVDNLDEALPEADFVLLHVDGKECILGTEQIAKLKKDAFVGNYARGGSVEIKALLERLEAGELFADLDVFANEQLRLPEHTEPTSNSDDKWNGPFKDGTLHKLAQLDNCSLSDHIGGSIGKADERNACDAFNGMIDFVLSTSYGRWDVSSDLRDLPFRQIDAGESVWDFIGARITCLLSKQNGDKVKAAFNEMKSQTPEVEVARISYHTTPESARLNQRLGMLTFDIRDEMARAATNGIKLLRKLRTVSDEMRTRIAVIGTSEQRVATKEELATHSKRLLETPWWSINKHLELIEESSH